MSDRAEPSQTTPEPADRRRRSEGVTLACAVSAAVALGVAFGLWVNARLAPIPPPAAAATTARLLPSARPSAPPAPAARPSTCDGCETSPKVEPTPAHAHADKADEAGPPKASEATAVSAAAPRRAVEVAAAGAEPRGVAESEPVAAPGPDPSRPVAWKVGSAPKAVARVKAEQGAAEGEGAQAQPVPCALYASANSLRLPVGDAAPLILGGPGAGVRINVSTPDSSELAVIYEGPADGDNGWLRYSVRSLGRRPGLYTVRYSTPCGSQTIPVTVK